MRFFISFAALLVIGLTTTNGFFFDILSHLHHKVVGLSSSSSTPTNHATHHSGHKETSHHVNHIDNGHDNVQHHGGHHIKHDNQHNGHKVQTSIKHSVEHHGGHVTHGRHHSHHEQHDYHGNKGNYDFKYSIIDPKTGDIKNQWEHRDGDKVKGAYSLKEADGSTRVVNYSADDKKGFQATVHKIEHGHHDAHNHLGHHVNHGHHDDRGGHGHHSHGGATSYSYIKKHD